MKIGCVGETSVEPCSASTSCETSVVFFFSSRRRHTRSLCDWSSDVCSSDLTTSTAIRGPCAGERRIAVEVVCLAGHDEVSKKLETKFVVGRADCVANQRRGQPGLPRLPVQLVGDGADRRADPDCD